MTVSPGAAVAGAAQPRPASRPPRLKVRVRKDTVRQIELKLSQMTRATVQPRRGKAAVPHRDPLGCRVQPFGDGFDTKTVEPEQDDAGALTIPHADPCRSPPASQFRHNARLRLQLLDRSCRLPNAAKKSGVGYRRSRRGFDLFRTLRGSFA